MAGVVRFTVESNAVQGTSWTPEIQLLLEINARSDAIDVARTAGARRESGLPEGSPEAAARVALMMQLPVVYEAFVLGASDLFGESELTDDDEPDRLEAVCIALRGRPPSALPHSDLEDAVHLHAHQRSGRDYFVTTDERMHRQAVPLAALGIVVVWPVRALEIARAATGA